MRVWFFKDMFWDEIFSYLFKGFALEEIMKFVSQAGWFAERA